MHNKIREYVVFKLRGDHSTDHEEKREEIISNITDRYDALLEKTKDPDYSYIEAIKTIGEFLEEEKEETSVKPEFAEMLLISATIFAILSVLLTILNEVVGGVIVGISMSLYAVGAVYLYQLSKFTECEEYDVRKYQLFLDKTFSYMKTNFTFWAISLSLIISQLLYRIFFMIATFETIGQIDFESGLEFEDIYGVYILTFVAFLLILGIIGALFMRLYHKLMKKYQELSGNQDIQSIGRKAKNFLGNPSVDQNIFVSKWFYSLLHGIIIIFLFLDVLATTGSYNARYESIVNTVVAIHWTFILLYLAVTILYLINVIKQHFIMPIFTIIASIFIIIVYTTEEIYQTESISGPFFFFTGVIFIILFIIDYILNRKTS